MIQAFLAAAVIREKEMGWEGPKPRQELRGCLSFDYLNEIRRLA